MPTLPNYLRILNCTYNNLYCLPVIPASLGQLSAMNNHITCLYDVKELGYGAPLIGMDSTYQICGSSNNIHGCPYAPNYVTIPDPAFAAGLQITFPTCMNISGQLDTTCPAVINATSLNLSTMSYSISDITGIQYFKKLDSLICSNTITNWSTLPSSITYFVVELSQITSLPQLPPSLTHLQCDNNKLSSLSALPATLNYLDFSDNMVTSFPILSTSLDTLICGGNQLTSLPALPDSLVFFDCSFNNINCLPLLPAKLQSLQILNNYITCLPNFPNSLKFIDNGLQVCNDDTNNRYHCTVGTYVSIPDPNWGSYLQANFPGCLNSGGMLDTTCAAALTVTSINVSGLNIGDLTGIEYFTNLDTLNCSGNYLGYLPPLPPSLTYLNCSNNELTSLPGLTDSATSVIDRIQKTASLVTLNCQNNLLTCLPLLPNSLQTLDASGNQITCLVNVPTSLINTDGAYSLCDNTNNTNGCAVQSVTSIASAVSIKAVEVFPNPSIGVVTISCQFNATGVTISGMDGKTVYQTSASTTNYTIDLSGIAKGLYVAQVSSANGVVTQKVVVQ